jgi:sulfide:quinone oxidoreductase
MRVVIAGGGIAGLETLLALRELAGDRVEPTVISPQPDFTYRPMTVEEPFSLQPAERHELAPLVEELGGRFVQQPVAAVHPESHRIEFADAAAVKYDAAVMCIGAELRAAYPDVATLGAPPGSDAVDQLVRRGGPRLALIVPPGVSWPLPIYELALMAERRARRESSDVAIEVFTPEAAPLIMFGTVASAAVAELLAARGIEVHTGAFVTQSEGDDVLRVMPQVTQIDPRDALALPALDGPRLAGLPADDEGFIPIDEHARVVGVDDVYAAGDGTTFPIKQGGLGTQQADAAAEHIVSRLDGRADATPFHPVLRGKLITGAESLSLQHDITGGHGEGVASSDFLWWPPHKVSGRYLAPWLAGETPHRDPAPPGRTTDVEIALPVEWHREPMALDPYDSLGVS